MTFGNMSQVSLRPVHLARWVIIILILGSILFWYFQRLKSQQELADSNRGLEYKMPPPSLSVEDGPEFVLDGKKLRILSGSIHYFRIVPEYWEDRLLKMKACGLNTVTVYVPWNKHEEVRGDFDFSGILDIEKFLTIAKKLSLYVILRPGPYICAEWEFGGLPSWLLQYDEMQIRSTYPLYLEAVDQYFKELIPRIAKFQYSRDRGPIIAVQVENEFGSYGDDKPYLKHIKEILQTNGITELLVTSDNSWKHLKDGSVDNVFMTVNFQNDVDKHLGFLKTLQGADKPLMVMEFWSGWFDHWGEKHHVLDVEATDGNYGLSDLVKDILTSGASINFYMFHGGTNFGFMNGGNLDDRTNAYEPTITSYDYDAPLSESGDTTAKFFKIKELLKAHSPKGTVPSTLPNVPTQIGKMAYPSARITHYMTLDDVLDVVGMPLKSEQPLRMEKLPINKNGGQGYGFLLYRTTVDHKPGKMLLDNPPQDRAQVFLNGQEVGLLERQNDNDQKSLEFKNGRDGDNTLEFLVENMGRVNYGKFLNHEQKGLLGYVIIDGKKQLNWEMYPMEFKQPFLQAASASSKWKEFASDIKRPALYKAVLDVPESPPRDTFIDMRDWEKGVIFVNGFNLGRYWTKGPQVTYYLPGPLLKTGNNEILIFELHHSSTDVKFVDKPNLGPAQHVKDD